jgi:hypothetical protein
VYLPGYKASNTPKAKSIVPDGGIIDPKELADISVVAAKCPGNLVLIIAGIVKTPVAATFPGPVPERAAINVLEIRETHPAPPLNLPTIANIKSIT